VVKDDVALSNRSRKRGLNILYHHLRGKGRGGDEEREGKKSVGEMGGSFGGGSAKLRGKVLSRGGFKKDLFSERGVKGPAGGRGTFYEGRQSWQRETRKRLE